MFPLGVPESDGSENPFFISFFLPGFVPGPHALTVNRGSGTGNGRCSFPYRCGDRRPGSLFDCVGGKVGSQKALDLAKVGDS